MEEAKNMQSEEHKNEHAIFNLRAKGDLSDYEMKCFRDLFGLLNINKNNQVDVNDLNDLIQMNFDNIDEINSNTQYLDFLSFVECICKMPNVRCKVILRKFIRNYLHRKRSKAAYVSSLRFLLSKSRQQTVTKSTLTLDDKFGTIVPL